MKEGLCILLLLGLGLSGCSKTADKGAVSVRTETYEVEDKGDHIHFVGIDHPSVATDLPGDRYETCSKIGRRNVTRFKRCYAEADKAFTILRALVKTTDTAVLLNSFRSGYAGEIDYYVSRDGNIIIAKELSKRRPLPEELVRGFDRQRTLVFLGDSGPPLFRLESILDYAADKYE